MHMKFGQDYYPDMLPRNLENYTDKISDNNFYIGNDFQLSPPDCLFENIDSVNEAIYGTKQRKNE
jgi:hypothetical protein